MINKINGHMGSNMHCLSRRGAKNKEDRIQPEEENSERGMGIIAGIREQIDLKLIKEPV